MPTFRYEAVDERGSNLAATVEALTEKEAVSKIRKMGYYPTKIAPLKPAVKQSPRPEQPKVRSRTSSKVKTKIITEFVRELATLQEAGLPILRSLRSLERQEKSKEFRKVVGCVADDIEGGATLSEAMSRHPGCFDRLFVGMVAAGEKGGVLELILTNLADYMEKNERLKAKIHNAMVYPTAVLTTAFMLLILLMTFVIPRFEAVIKEMTGDHLNVITRTVFGIASWTAKDFGWLILLGVPVVLTVIFRILRHIRPTRLILDKLTFKTPVAGGIASQVCIARWTRTLGTLLGAGVPILDAIEVTSQATGNEVFSRMLKRIGEAINQGDTFINPVRQSKLMPPSAENMLAVGEETGDLDKMLIRVADKYDERVDLQVASLMTLLEPAMIILLGLVVLFIILAILLPIIGLFRGPVV